MCCRYYVEMLAELRPIVDEAEGSALKERMVSKLGRPLVTEGKVRPTDIVPVIAPNRSGARAVFPMVWGFSLPRFSSPLVNARVETAGTKPTFKESWERRRCIIPASYYFEWEHVLNAATGKTRTGDKYTLFSPENPVKRSDSSMTGCRSSCLKKTSRNGSALTADRMRSSRIP